VTKLPNEKDRPRRTRPIFIKFERFGGLLPILLDAGGAQTGKTMLIDGKLPGQEFIDRQSVAAAGLLKGEQTTTDGGNDFGLTADNPPFGSGCWQIRNR
jgi:hypothetical protein